MRWKLCDALLAHSFRRYQKIILFFRMAMCHITNQQIRPEIWAIPNLTDGTS